MRNWFSVQKSMEVIHYIKSLGEKSHDHINKGRKNIWQKSISIKLSEKEEEKVTFSSWQRVSSNAGDLGSIPGLGRCSGGGHGNPLQNYICVSYTGRRILFHWATWASLRLYLMVKCWTLPHKIGNKEKISILISLIQHGTGSSSQWNKDIKGKQIRNEEIKLCLFSNNKIIYIGNPKESTKKFFFRINKSVPEGSQDTKLTYKNQLYFRLPWWSSG